MNIPRSYFYFFSCVTTPPIRRRRRRPNHTDVRLTLMTNACFSFRVYPLSHPKIELISVSYSRFVITLRSWRFLSMAAILFFNDLLPALYSAIKYPSCFRNDFTSPGKNWTSPLPLFSLLRLLVDETPRGDALLLLLLLLPRNLG